MKAYKSSDLTHKRAEIFKEARGNNVLIEERRTNGEVVNQFVLVNIENTHKIFIGDVSSGEFLTVIKGDKND